MYLGRQRGSDVRFHRRDGWILNPRPLDPARDHLVESAELKGLISAVTEQRPASETLKAAQLSLSRARAAVDTRKVIAAGGYRVAVGSQADLQSAAPSPATRRTAPPEFGR